MEIVQQLVAAGQLEGGHTVRVSGPPSEGATVVESLGVRGLSVLSAGSSLLDALLWEHSPRHQWDSAKMWPSALGLGADPTIMVDSL